MPFADTQLPGKGFGKTGYCKLCHWEHEPELNRLIKAGKNAADCDRWATDKFGFHFTRQTFYKHKEHVEKGVTVGQSKAVVPIAPGGKLQIRKGSNREFLETIRDIGLAKAELDPDAVSIDQSLKAAQILETSKQKQTDLTIVFAQVVTGQRPDIVVEGTAREVGAAPSE